MIAIHKNMPKFDNGQRIPMMPMKSPFPLGQGSRDYLDRLISSIGSTMNRVYDKGGFPLKRCPVIAGGAVRDRFLGVSPKDIDVFFDVSNYPEDERDDATLDFSLRVAKGLEEDCPQIFQDMQIHAFTGNYDGEAIRNEDHFATTKTNTHREMYIYEMHYSGNRVDVELFSCPVQFIGRVDERLSQENPLPFVEDFDWNGVKALYDPLVKLEERSGFVGEYLTTKAFDALLKDRIIDLNEYSDSTRSRISRFINHNPQLNNVFKITYPKKKKTRPLEPFFTTSFVHTGIGHFID